MLDEFVYGIKTDMVNKVVLGATSFRLGVDTTVVVLAVSTEGRKRER